MEQPLELEGDKINSLLTEMTDIVRELRRRDADTSHVDAALMHGGYPAAVPRVDAPRATAD